ncbi:MAG: right-handed parallel beta-helix repeat-containing protein [Phycisphaerales bacterium]|nr:MAG: right-handed parallel beta-helix repeat-containing protein [Phycisphaerales bacterium]
MKTNHLRLVRFALPALLLTGAILYAGPLNPPAGPITSTHKTLTEVEPRVAINSTNTPGDTNSEFRIASSGSYYLTGNITVTAGRVGIEIAASNVTVDLNGFSIIGQAGSLSGATAFSTLSNITFKDGAISTIAAGLQLGSVSAARVERVNMQDITGIGLQVGTRSIVRNCIVRTTTSTGISASAGSHVEGCIVTAAGATGISLGNQCVLDACTVSDCAGAGVSFAGGCVITGCAARTNGDDGFLGSGSGTACVVRDCTAVDNIGDGFSFQVDCVVTSCTARSNEGHGFTSGVNFTISNCSATFNTLSGIRAGGGSALIQSNTCSFNGNNLGDGAGIWAQASVSRIEGNHCFSNDRGIDVDSAGNFIARNTCSGNATNWDVAANNKCLVVLGVNAGAVVGNSGGVSPGSADPNANFSY